MKSSAKAMWAEKWNEMDASEQVTLLQNLDMNLTMNQRRGISTTDMNGILLDKKPRKFSNLSPTTKHIIKNWYDGKLPIM